MGPTGDIILTLGKAFGLMFLATAVMGIIMVVFLDIWGKRHTAGKINGIFLEQKHLFTKLLAIEGGKVFLGKGDDKEEYLLDTDKQFWCWWPAGLPRMVQVPVRAHWYVKGVPEPIDPENTEASISARSLRMIADEAMLGATWKDVKESIGGGIKPQRSSSMALVMVFVTLALSGFTLYMVMQLQPTIEEILNKLG